MQGKLIVFEGGEGSGKTTQIQAAYEWLLQSDRLAKLQQQGLVSQLILTREPGGTLLGKTLRQLLLYSSEEPIADRTELLLYAADRAQHVETCLQPLLQSGAIILCDRFTDSTIAYQGYGRGLDRSLIDQLNQIATGGLQSDLTVWLEVEVTVGLDRARQRRATASMGHDRIEQSDLSFHQRVQRGFQELAQRYPDRIVAVDASPDPDTVAQQIQTVLTQKLHHWYSRA
ncbi:MAG: dTMP kinase [Elainella sp. Prado103]|jgi:dTMP kinase|nr:dTMP kinase [Elainella sp. Prado103]